MLYFQTKFLKRKVLEKWNNCNHEFVGEPKDTLHGYGQICKKCNLFKREKIKHKNNKIKKTF